MKFYLAYTMVFLLKKKQWNIHTAEIPFLSCISEGQKNSYITLYSVYCMWELFLYTIVFVVVRFYIYFYDFSMIIKKYVRISFGAQQKKSTLISFSFSFFRFFLQQNIAASMETPRWWKFLSIQKRTEEWQLVWPDVRAF